MLQEVNGTIMEFFNTDQALDAYRFDNQYTPTTTVPSTGTVTTTDWPYSNQTVWWNGYPVHVYSDKTAKSIEILKKLQAEKVIDVKSVPRFIALVEQISAIL